MSFTVKKGGGGRGIIHGTSDKYLNAKIKNRKLDAKLLEIERQIDIQKDNELKIIKHEQDLLQSEIRQKHIISNKYTRAGLHPSRSFDAKPRRNHNDKSRTHAKEDDAVDFHLLAYKSRRRTSSAGAADMAVLRPLHITGSDRGPELELDKAISKLAYKSHRRSSSLTDIDVSRIASNLETSSSKDQHFEEENDILEETFDSLLAQAKYRSRRRTSSAGAADMVRPKPKEGFRSFSHKPISERNESSDEDILDSSEELERFQKLRSCLRRKSRSLNDISMSGLRERQQSGQVTNDKDGLERLLNDARERVRNFNQCYKERFGVRTPIQAFQEATSPTQSESAVDIPINYEITNTSPPKKNLGFLLRPKDIEPYDLLAEQVERDAAKLRNMTKSDEQTHNREMPFPDVVKNVIYN